MDIAKAMEQVRNGVRAYLSRDERGLLRIPVPMQRPMLMLGPPGVGKTAIVEQVAAQLGVNFVSYSITHHTRQTALGLPAIVQREFGGKPYQVSEYTMSEIIGAVHEAIERTGVAEGILFLDEVNCVSETLAPAMLQFLQYKTFGQHRLPEGWVIVCAGNPPEYNRAAREFDPAVMDRLKCIPVEPDVNVWLEYAVAQGVHPAIVGYLQAKPDAFYLVRAGVQGMRLVTARGWDDLSRMLLAYEAEGIVADEELILQYLQDADTARDFSVHYQLFRKYRDDYQVPAILAGEADAALQERAATAPFDERMALVSLLSDALLQRVHAASELEQGLRLVRADLLDLKPALVSDGALEALSCRIEQARAGEDELVALRDALGNAQAIRAERVRGLEGVAEQVARAAAEGADAFGAAREAFNAECRRQRGLVGALVPAIERAYAFLDGAFGPAGQEVLVFTTRLSGDAACITYAAQGGAGALVAHSQGLLIRDRTQALLQELEALEEAPASS